MANTRVVVSQGRGHNHGATFSTIEEHSNNERCLEAARKKSEAAATTKKVGANSKRKTTKRKKKVTGPTSNGDMDATAQNQCAKKIKEQISSSNCFKCGKKGHWKQEFPEESDYESDRDMSMMTVANKRSEKLYGYEAVLNNISQVNIVHPRILTNIKSGSGSFKGVNKKAKSSKTLPFYRSP